MSRVCQNSWKEKQYNLDNWNHWHFHDVSSFAKKTRSCAFSPHLRVTVQKQQKDQNKISARVTPCMLNTIPDENNFTESQSKETVKMWQKRKKMEEQLIVLFLLKALKTSQLCMKPDSLWKGKKKRHPRFDALCVQQKQRSTFYQHT